MAFFDAISEEDISSAQQEEVDRGSLTAEEAASIPLTEWASKCKRRIHPVEELVSNLKAWRKNLPRELHKGHHLEQPGFQDAFDQQLKRADLWISRML